MESDRCFSEESDLCQAALEQNLFPGDLIIEIGRFFLGAPYQTDTLEAAGRERLIINLAEFDCTTFVETVLALTRCAAAGKLSPSEFRKYLKFIRYRQAKIDDYASRLHYFTDWLRDNEKKKVLRDVTRLFNGKPKRKKINFMTMHRELYAGLKNEEQLGKMLLVEENLSRRAFYIIDRDKVARMQSAIQQGDIIAFATDQEGLDVAHVGFAVRQGRQLHLLHASSKEGAVIISKETLPAYLKFNKKFTGILVARFL
ncbi:MAG TPA: DUF1460 domain-containing protein [Smithellaceae bacterium]|nr:DUF1460 domain-containing protein [Smithellaceae bacterium]HRY38630.1 DUF1460 domain-containing protein [Smithellaceae bacterium]